MQRDFNNRPQRYGAQNRAEFITQDSEVSMVCINNTDGAPLLVGRALPGTSLAAPKWQIMNIAYDSNGGVTRVTWPENELGVASANYEFTWAGGTELSVTGITQAATAVVTVSDLESIQNGDSVIFQNVGGMTQVNFTGSNIYTVANINVGAKTFELSGINSTGYTAYTMGGTASYGGYAEYTYS